MSIWFNKAITKNDFSDWGNNTLSSHLGIEFTDLGGDFLCAKMPVDNRTRQPYGLLHGGASAVLAETLGSVASALVVDHDKFITLGIEINANHIKAVKSGFVTGTCRPLHLGSTIHVWDIKITDDANKLICISRLTVAIRKRSE